MKDMRKSILFLVLVADWLTVLASTPIKLPKGTQAGMYMTYGKLASSGNYIDNACLIYDGNKGWTSEKSLFWKTPNDWAHFYCYAPYNANVTNARAIYFTVNTDQTTSEAQAASDFLYGEVYASPIQSDLPNPSMRHLLSKIVIKVVTGTGFTENELKDGLSVRIKNVCTQAKIDLYGGGVNTAGQSANIKAYAEDAYTFSAIVVPQQIENLSVVWNNTEYILSFNRACCSGMVYTLTATLKKTSGGIDISIGGWEDSGEDFGGTVQ